MAPKYRKGPKKKIEKKEWDDNDDDWVDDVAYEQDDEWYEDEDWNDGEHEIYDEFN